jgi:predicted enzyme related to lactoylglutathione lyase
MSKIVHFEVPAQDTGRAKEFWGSLFGVDFQQYDGPVEYHMFQNDDQTGGAVMPRQDAGQRGLVTYFNVDDMDAARRKVEQLGGKAEDKMPIPGMGWIAHAQDTEGNPFSLWQSDPNAPAPEGMG